nr:putative ribonuclease H-like domain-containing protein [Tanacetum cinerariifolium]
EFSVPRTPQQNGITERKNRTLIEAARTMLADSLLPIPFWAEAVNTACYVQNSVLVTKPHNKTPYELLHGRSSSTGPTWLFDIDYLSGTMNYHPATIGNQTNYGADCSENSSNEVTTASSAVPTIGQNSLNNTNTISAVGISNTAVSLTCGDASQFPDDPDMPGLEDIIYSDDEDVVGAEADFNNLESFIQIIKDQCGLSQMFVNDFHTCMFACFLSQEEPKRKVWVLVDVPYGKRAIGTKWVYKNKKDEIGIVIRNKARLVAQGHTQEEGIDYKEVFAPVVRIEAIRLFLAYASFVGFMVYQMDVKSAFLYGTIEEEVYVCQPLWFEDPDHPDKVCKVVKALYGLHQAPRAWYKTLATYLLENGFQRGTIDQTLFIKKHKGHIMLVQIYIDDIIFGATIRDLCRSFEKLMKDKFQMSSIGELTFFLGKSASLSIDTEKPLLKDPDVKRIFRYLKGKLHLGLWYPKDSPFDLVAYSDSDYAGASLDRKSTTGGCQFLGCRLISLQCKKQTVVATSSTEAEYVDAASCYAQ